MEKCDSIDIRGLMLNALSSPDKNNDDNNKVDATDKKNKK